MRNAKGRTHDRKRKRKEMSVRKTEESRARRLANKAKRDEIHAINPDLKLKVIDQVVHIVRDDITEDGVIYKPVEVVNNKISAILPVIESETVVATDVGKAIDAQIEKERIGVFNPFKWKKK